MMCKVTVKKKSEIETVKKRQLVELQEGCATASTNSRPRKRRCRPSISHPTTHRRKRRSSRLAVLKSVSASKSSLFSGSRKTRVRAKSCFTNRRGLTLLHGQLFKKVSNTGGGDCFFKAIAQGLR